MKSKLLPAAVLFSCASCAYAGPVTFSSINVTGADMAGLKVTAFFQGGGSESLIWSTLTTDLGVSGNDIVDHEGFSGGVSGTGWSLTQQGYTFGDVNAGNVYGAWSFTDDSAAGITELVIETNGSGIYFDTETFNDPSEDLNGSGQGRPVTAFIGNAAYNDFSFTYGDHLLDEIYGSLALLLNDPGTSFGFLADTDAATVVPEPATLILFGTSLLGFRISRKRPSTLSSKRAG